MEPRRKTIVINLIAGPSSGKTSMAAYLFYKLKVSGYVVEYVPEYAKNLVWLKDFETLNNQHYVSSQQNKMLSAMIGLVDFIITDGPVISGLYYNRFNKDNTSNIDKTERDIIAWYQQANNVNIFLERGDIPYEKEGRYQGEKEAKQIDVVLDLMLTNEKIEFTKFSTLDRKGILAYVKSKHMN